MNLTLKELEIPDYERVIHITSSESGLEAIIAIHNTTLGPALGGIRILPYKSFADALSDSLRLSQGMTYKAAFAGIGLGGGKTVIIHNPQKELKKEMLWDLGEAVDALHGQYICAEDMNCTTNELAIINQKTKYVVGLDHCKSSGNPSPFTAYGVFIGIEAICMHLFGNRSVQGKKIVVQGLGSVGKDLASRLFWAGADLVFADINEERAAEFAKKFGATSVSVEESFSQECDILAPCAIGGIVNKNTIPILNCRAIGGCANNILQTEEDGIALYKKGILYAPDFVINAGGLINVTNELKPEGYQAMESRKSISTIYENLLAIFETSEKLDCSTNQTALQLARSHITHSIGKRQIAPHFHHSTLISSHL